MRPAERFAAIRNIAAFLAPKSKAEVDLFFMATGRAASVVVERWEAASEDARRDALLVTLSDMDDAFLEILLEMLPEHEQKLTVAPTTVVSAVDPVPPVRMPPSPDGPIFVVHGHARAAMHEAVRVLERATGREVIVLHEQVNVGRTILEKFEDYAGQVSFAVVLLTGDDEGGVRSSENLKLRGRQNVIFELGFFFGKLGRKRVAVLLESNIEKPSDIDGLVYISIDGAGAWKYALVKELEGASISVDRSRIP